MTILPPKHKLTHLLGDNDFFLWEYYGKGFLGRIQALIFRSRIKMLVEFLRKANFTSRMIMDVGCGPMFVSYVLVSNATREYIGVDIMNTSKLKKYRDAMKNIGVKTIEAVRASAEMLPFRNGVFDFALSLDVLEHLSKPREAAMEICRVVNNDSMVVISLPMENLFQKVGRIGFALMKITGDPILKKTNHIPITRTPKYHYVGNIKSYDDMAKMLMGFFSPLHIKYTPMGFHKAININAVHIFQKK
ncbi:MAG: class I SAM-dependent methyltransferase [Candidatus Bathyarchaeia archaeon]